MHGSCVVVDVIGSLAISKQLNPLDQARWMAHDGVEIVCGIVVDEAKGYFDAVGVQPVTASRQRNARRPGGRGGESAETARVELDIFPRYDVGRVASAHLVVQRADELVIDGVGHLIHRSCLAFPSTAPLTYVRPSRSRRLGLAGQRLPPQLVEGRLGPLGEAFERGRSSRCRCCWAAQSDSARRAS